MELKGNDLEYMIFRAKEIKDTLRLTGNIYKARTEETAYSRGFIRSEKYINELIEELETLSRVNEKKFTPKAPPKRTDWPVG